MENNISDDSDDYEFTCPYRSPALRKALLEIPTIEVTKTRVRKIKDISGQFIEDIDVILEKCGSNHYVIMILHEFAIDLAIALKGEKQKITVDTIKEPTWNNLPDFKRVDTMHIFQAILLRELPPERIGGIINLELAMRRKATVDEIEDSLRYLYGTGPYVKIANIPPLLSKARRAKDLDNADINEETLDKLKSMIDVKPQVIEDVTALFEKFPHDNLITQVLFSFITDLVEDLHGDITKIDTITIKTNAKTHEEDDDISSSNVIESIFSTRLDKEIYCGLINLMNAFSPNTSDDDIEKALEYLYGPKEDAS